MAEIELDLAGLEASVASMSYEDLIKQLVEFKAKQKANTKKYYNPETAKKARLKRAAQISAMEKFAKENGMWDAIKAKIEERADELLGDQSEENEVETVKA